MKTTLFIEHQLSNINVLFQQIVGDITDQEWVSRVTAGRNLLGYTAWHIPRTQDNFVQTWIRGVPEVVHSAAWAQWQLLKQTGIGAGISLEEADEIARIVRRADVLAYAAAVHQEMLGWLRELADNDLDQIPEAVKHMAAYPEYQTHGYHEDTDSLLNKPVWTLLIRPCTGHVHRHLGELEVAKNILRTGK